MYPATDSGIHTCQYINSSSLQSIHYCTYPSWLLHCHHSNHMDFIRKFHQNANYPPYGFDIDIIRIILIRKQMSKLWYELANYTVNWLLVITIGSCPCLCIQFKRVSKYPTGSLWPFSIMSQSGVILGLRPASCHGMCKILTSLNH